MIARISLFSIYAVASILLHEKLLSVPYFYSIALYSARLKLTVSIQKPLVSLKILMPLI